MHSWSSGGASAVANAGVLQGQLEEFRLIELVQALGIGANSGALHVHRSDDLTGIIYFDSGNLVGATELDSEALSFGYVLQQLDLADETQIEHAYHLQTQDPLGKRLGERLVDLGILTHDQLQPALRTQILWTVRDMALWRTGSYEFHRGQEVPFPVETRVDSGDATMEILRYEHEWEALSPYLRQGMRTELRMAFEPPIGHTLRFPAPTWRLISRVNTHKRVRRIATALHIPEVDAARGLAPLVREGLLTPVESETQHWQRKEVERMSLKNFELFSLLLELEQDWVRRKGKGKSDHLVALARYINQTMRSLEEACQLNNLGLAPDTLATILVKEQITGVEAYQFRVQNNRIDVDDFAAFVRKRLDALRSSPAGEREFYAAASAQLQGALAAAFQAINARVVLPNFRTENQTAWEALFQTFNQDPPPAG